MNCDLPLPYVAVVKKSNKQTLKQANIHTTKQNKKNPEPKQPNPNSLKWIFQSALNQIACLQMEMSRIQNGSFEKESND